MADTLSENNDAESSVKDDDKILEEIKQRFAICEEAYSEKRRLFDDDIKFSAGDQWDQGIKKERDKEGRPTLVINKINQSINQVTNDQRQNRPSIKVYPVDEGGDKEIAEIAQGLIRNIEQISNADAAYDTAFEYVARGGEGYWRIITEYASPTSFDLDLKIKRIRDPRSVYLDPNSTEPDGSDAQYGFVHERISHDEYKRTYGESDLAKADSNDLGRYSESLPGWISKDSCLITEYFCKVFEEKEICLLSNGQVVFKEKLEDSIMLLASQGIAVAVVKERKASIPKIKWIKTNGIEKLGETYFPGIYIPIIPCYGAELVIDGKVIHKGITRDAKDPQRMVNFWASNEAEVITLAPKAPYIGYEGQFEGREHIWANANRKNYGFLEVKPVSVGGQLAPLPQRNSFEPAVQAITQARMLAGDDLKATSGIYDAGLGAQSNETSGIAIQRRATQGQTANFHLIDNLTRSIKHTGRILIYAIPEVYDAARAARIVTEEGEEKIVRLNEPFEKNGKQVLYTIEAGKYDVGVSVGPSFQTKRQEAVASMIDIAKAYPKIMEIAGDLFVKNQDWPGSQEIADRLKKLPPIAELADDKNNKNPIPPQVQAQLQQSTQMVEALTAKLHELQDEKEQKLIELESKERIEMKKLEVQLEIKRAELDAKDSLALLTAEISQINEQQKLIHAHYMAAQEQPQISEPLDGGEPAYVEEFEQNPIGGEPPSTPMEGM